MLCDDFAWPRSVEQYRQELLADTTRYPMFAIIGSHIWPCAFWSNEPIEQAVPITASANRMLIVHNRRDPATPHAGAVDMRIALGQRARLVTIEQGGHGASYGEHNDCAKETVTTYLVAGRLPASDMTCAAEPPTKLPSNQENAIRKLRRRMW